MPTPISKDIKDQVLARVREGKDTVVEIARQHGLKISTVYGWISRSVAGSGRVNFNRDLGAGNNTGPGVAVIWNPNLILNFPSQLTDALTDWREVAP